MNGGLISSKIEITNMIVLLSTDFSWGKDLKDDNKNKEMITYSYLLDAHYKYNRTSRCMFIYYIESTYTTGYSHKKTLQKAYLRVISIY